MASQPGVHNEERNLLRLRAREQRNQETSQTTELNSENVPLFGEPYKTTKGDELSNRIKRMLGSYEDVNDSCPFPMEALPIPSYATFSLSDPSQPSSNKSAKPPFHNQLSTESQIEPPPNGYSSQPSITSSTSPSPNHRGHSSTFSNPSLSHSRGDQFGPSAHQQKVSSDLRERVGFPQEISALCPDVKPPPILHSSDYSNTDTDTFDRHRRRGSTDHPESVITMEVSTANIKQSPKDVAPSQANKSNVLPSQTFPPLLSSKQPSVVMTQKPTAYVRPTMDGQDQVISESPELKPSPQPFVPLTDFSKSDQDSKNKIKPQFSESRTDEARCVEDILMEMTHSWPPLLTAIHTPNTEEPSKFLFPAKEAERVSSCPGQKNDSLPAQSSHPNRPSFSISFQTAHSSGGEFASSSDSDSSSGSESESEGTTEDPPQASVRSSVKTKPDTPALSHGDWQLGNWIRSSQQSSSTEGQGGAHVPESPAHKQLPPTHSSKRGEAFDPIREPITKPLLSPCQKEFSVNLTIPQQRSETPQENHSQPSGQKALSADVNGLGGSRKLSKPVKAGRPDRNDGALSVKSEDVVTTQTKDLRPKVKTKIGHGKKSKDKRDSKRDTKRTIQTSQAASEPPEVPPSLSSHCSSCKGHYPNPCSCPNPSPAQPDLPSPAPPVSRSEPKAEAICQRGTKTSHETTRKHSEKPGHTAKDSRALHRPPPRSLLVKIDLSLLSRPPHTPTSTYQGIPSNAKTSAAVRERDGGGGEASKTQKRTKSSKKNRPQNVDVENKTLPRKKQKLENNNTSSTRVSTQLESSSNPAETQEKKKAKKNVQQPAAFKGTTKDSKLRKDCSGKSQESGREALKSKDSRKQRKSSGKHTEPPHSEKQKPTKRSLMVPSPSQPMRDSLTNRPLLRFEERPYPVKHYIKEAKKLKHKADAESDKMTKAFNYLDAAMFFVESGIAMGKDPQISMSSYTMFAETVELLKFVLKLKNPVDPSSPPSEKDFIALCLKCQSLLQMALFRPKQKTALKYSKTLTDHFNNSAQGTHNPPPIASKIRDQPSPSVPSPANPSAGGGGAAVATSAVLPPALEQVAFNYVAITTLVLSAHDMWEQAEEMAHRGSGMLGELDAALGPLSLSSTMSCMVRYTRQGVHWLRKSSPKV